MLWMVYTTYDNASKLCTANEDEKKDVQQQPQQLMNQLQKKKKKSRSGSNAATTGESNVMILFSLFNFY